MIDARLTLDDATLDEIARRVALILAQTDSGPPPAESRFLTIIEAAELLRCSRQRVDDLLSSGRLSRVKDGRRTLVSRAELEHYLGGDRR